MRHFFMDMERLKRKAKESLDSGVVNLKRWWSRKYELPANHKLFTSQSIAALHQEQYEDLYAQRVDIMADIENRTGDQALLLTQLNSINRALGEETQSQDDLFDQWEKDIEEGRTPDLDAQIGA